MPFGSTAEYAKWRRERGLTGTSSRAIERAIADGKIKRRKDGKLDFKRCDANWEKNQAPRNLNGSGKVAVSLQEARARKANAEAQIAEDALRRSRGELVEVAKVNQAWQSIARRIRDGMMAIPGRVAGELAGELAGKEPNVRRVEERLEEEVRKALESLEGER